MDYTLQPGLKIVSDRAIPEFQADQHIFSHPQPTNTNNCCRASTVLVGTAPYMAQKGAPAPLIGVEDTLRPQSTTEFNKSYASRAYDFPSKNVKCVLPQRTIAFEPMSTRAEVQNGMFLQRYCNK